MCDKIHAYCGMYFIPFSGGMTFHCMYALHFIYPFIMFYVSRIAVISADSSKRPERFLRLKLKFHIFLFFFFFFFLFSFFGPPGAYRNFPARCWIRAAAVSLHHSHSNSNTISKPHLWHSSQQYRILNPLSDARDWTCIVMDTTLGS